MAEPKILGLAMDGKPEKPNPWAMVTRALSAIVARVTALEARPAPMVGRDGLAGRDGRDGAVGPQGPRGEPGPAGKDGGSVTVADVTPVIERAVAAEIAKIPAPKDGPQGPRGEPGPAGKDADPTDTERLIEEKVARAVAALPPPADTASIEAKLLTLSHEVERLANRDQKAGECDEDTQRRVSAALGFRV